jgi:hypothetical protein
VKKCRKLCMDETSLLAPFHFRINGAAWIHWRRLGNWAPRRGVPLAKALDLPTTGVHRILEKRL